MRSLFFIVVLLPFFSACQENNQNTKGNISSFSQKYKEKVNQELEKAKTKEENTLLLGFELGMSEEAYQSKFNALVKENTLKPLIDFADNSKFVSSSADTTDYFYSLEIDGEFYPLHFFPTFKDKKLSAISAKTSLKVGESKTERLYKNLVELYIKKYGDDYLERVNMYKPNDFVWIDANRQIILSVGFSTLQIDYSDSRKTDVHLIEGEKIKEENTSSSLDDI